MSGCSIGHIFHPYMIADGTLVKLKSISVNIILMFSKIVSLCLGSFYYAGVCSSVQFSEKFGFN